MFALQLSFCDAAYKNDSYTKENLYLNESGNVYKSFHDFDSLFSVARNRQCLIGFTLRARIG